MFVTWFGVTRVVISVLRSVYLLFIKPLHAAKCSLLFRQNSNYCQLQWDALPNVTQPVAHQLLCVSGEPPVDLHKIKSGLEEVVWVFLNTAWNHKFVSITAFILLPCFSLNKFPCVCLHVACMEDENNNNNKKQIWVGDKVKKKKSLKKDNGI